MPIQVNLCEGGQHSRHTFLPLRGTPPGVRLMVGIHLVGTSDQIELPEPVIQRLLCIAMVHHLNERGLAEAVQSLQDLVAFYSEQPAALPAPRPARRTSVTVARRYVEPVYPVTEE